MNVNKNVLLTLTSVALLVAAPISAQALQYPTIPTVAVHSPKYDLEVNYDLGSDGDRPRFIISNGIPGNPRGEPVVLMVGFKPLEAWLPDNATLRLDPVVFFELGNFDMLGQSIIPLHGLAKLPDPVSFYVQALSIAGDYTKLCTSQLVFIRTDFQSWQFEFMG